MNEELIQELSDKECVVADCHERQMMYIDCGFDMLPFCAKHTEYMMLNKPKLDKMAIEMKKDMDKSDGSTVIIKTFQECYN